VVRAKEELVEEPVDGVDVICPRYKFPGERCVLDQWPGRTACVKLGRDAAKQIVYLRRGITRDMPP
jgi:hypothetical protein